MSSTKCHLPFKYHSFQSASSSLVGLASTVAYGYGDGWPELSTKPQRPSPASCHKHWSLQINCLSFFPVHHLTDSAQDTLDDTKDYVHVQLNYSSWNPMTPFLPAKGVVGRIFMNPLNSSEFHELTYQKWTNYTTSGIHISISEFHNWTP